MYIMLVLAFVAYKAAMVSFSWDESYSYLHHVVHRVYWPVDNGTMGANHHLLNVWAMIAADQWLGNREWHLRSPNVLAFVLYGAAALWHASEARNALLAMLIALLLTLHPYLLDMFSLARGYGLGLGFMLLSLVAARHYLIHRRSRYLWVSLILAGLSAMSNLVWLNYLVVLPPAILTMELAMTTERRVVRSSLLPIVVSTGAFLALLLPVAMGLRDGGALYFGGDSVEEAIASTAALIFYYRPEYADTTALFHGVLAVVVALVVLAMVTSVLRRSRTDVVLVLFPVLVLILWLISIGVQHVGLQVPLPKHRTAIGLLPVLVLCATSALLSTALGRWTPTALAVLAAAPLVQLQVRAFTTSSFIEWRVSGEVRSMLEVVERETRDLPGGRRYHSVSVGFGCWMPLKYYKHIRGLDRMLVHPMGDAPDHERFDHYIVEYDKLHAVDSLNWTKRFHGAGTNTHLFRYEPNFRPGRSVALDTVLTVDGADPNVHFGLRAGGSRVFRHVLNARTAQDPIILVEVPTRRECLEDWIGLRAEIRSASGVVAAMETATPEELPAGVRGTLRLLVASPMALAAGDTLAISLTSARGLCDQLAGPVRLSYYVLSREPGKDAP